MTSVVLAALASEAQQAFPQECCGILLGEGAQITSIQPAQNVHPTPQSHFEIGPQALIDAHRNARNGGPEVVGYYHSHPNGSAHPSSTDKDLAAGDGLVWAIIGLTTPNDQPTIQFYRALTSGFAPLPLAPTAR